MTGLEWPAPMSVPDPGVAVSHPADSGSVSLPTP